MSTKLFLLIFLSGCITKNDKTDSNDQVKIDSINIELNSTNSLQKDDTMIDARDSFPIIVNYDESKEYLDKNYFKGKKRLSKTFVQEKLLLNSDSVPIQNVWSGDTLGFEDTKAHLKRTQYYLLDTVLHMDQFTGITYELISDHSEKYLYTFDAAGKMIARVMVATCSQMGSSATDNGGHVPFFEVDIGSIEKDFFILIEGSNTRKRYKILLNGSIEAIKPNN